MERTSMRLVAQQPKIPRHNLEASPLRTYGIWMNSDAGNFSAETSGNFSSVDATKSIRRLPVGAEPQRSGGVHFRVWAPDRRRVAVLLESIGSGKPSVSYNLERDDAGYFSGLLSDAATNMVYRYCLDGN